MTYNELLGYVDFLPLDGLMAWMQPALRAVIELHKSVTEIDLEDDEGNLFNADFCATCPDSPLYPCATIKAIEAVLSE